MRERRVSVVESVLSHVAIVAAVLFALYPVLWVVSTALSRGSAPERRVLPIPSGLTLDHLSQFLSGPHVLSQAASSLVVSIATAVVGIAIALPTAYALSRFTFVGKEAGVRLLLATQMFPMVASAVPLYIVLETLGLLDTRTGLVVCYATTSVPFAIFQLRGAFDTIPKDLEEAAMVDGATRTWCLRPRGAARSAPRHRGDLPVRFHERVQRVHPGGDDPGQRRGAHSARGAASATSASTTRPGAPSPQGPSW